MEQQVEGVFDGMEAYMGVLRWHYERARAVREISETVTLGHYHGRNRRVIFLGPARCREASAASQMADFHVAQAVADGVLFRSKVGKLEAEPPDPGRMHGLLVRSGPRRGFWPMVFAHAYGPLREGEVPRVVGLRGTPAFQVKRTFLP